MKCSCFLKLFLVAASMNAVSSISLLLYLVYLPYKSCNPPFIFCVLSFYSNSICRVKKTAWLTIHISDTSKKIKLLTTTTALEHQVVIEEKWKQSKRGKKPQQTGFFSPHHIKEITVSLRHSAWIQELKWSSLNILCLSGITLLYLN